MRKLFALLSLSMAQTIYYDENFNSVPPGGTPTGWSLNTSDVNSSTSPTNFWRVDAKYGLQNIVMYGFFPVNFSVSNQPGGVTGAPQSNFLYITLECDGVIISCTPDYPVAF
ncbi:MAG: hypothetical protein NZZ60_05250, partial [Bacteroidia bacterium]|nr:hypothetical protein [Bacteroidia bacterium]